MKMQLVPLTPNTFAGKTWQRYPSYAFAAQTHLAPVVMAELGKATTSLPLAFVQQGDVFDLVAVMSLRPESNMLIGPNGRWMGTYVPAALRSYPFVLARPPEAKDPVLCVDMASGLIKDDGSGEAILGADGKLTPAVQEVFTFLGHIEQSRMQTRAAAAALARAGVLKPWALSMEVQGKRMGIQGLLGVDEAALHKLDDEALLALRRAHALPLAYAQLFASNLMQTLVQLTQARAQPQAGGAVDAATLKAMGIATDDGLLKFD